jgi:cell shape-determining protein MreD
VKAAALFLVAFALQTSLARFPIPGAGLLDLVLVAVIYVALTEGPTAGILAGAVAGLTQDTLAATGASMISTSAGAVAARSIIGVGGLAKTVIGFVTGIVGTQFIIARPLPRALVFFTATVAHAIMFVGLYSVLGSSFGRTPNSAIFSQAGANALAGVLMFQVAEFIPGFVDRRRSTSGGMRINRRLD